MSNAPSPIPSSGQAGSVPSAPQPAVQLVDAAGSASQGVSRGTAGPVPGANGISRTQQKLMLQKDQLETQEAAVGASTGNAAVKFAKEIERIDREFATVERFHDPLAQAQRRVQASQSASEQQHGAWN
ncbi:hypothetical protein H9P43_010138 [Blastocladiella emersonii ATCC 22665]|nr:hypothetical protein H9P43_010138 [Blastocladiella emersonii ATCC 22665]